MDNTRLNQGMFSAEGLIIIRNKSFENINKID